VTATEKILRTSIRSLLFGALIGTCVSCSYSFTYVQDQPIKTCAAREILEAVEDAFHDEDYGTAKHLAEYIVKKHAKSVEAEDALYIAAESAYRLEDYRDAFEHFQDLIVKFPATRYSRLVVERDFAIGQAYLREGTGLFAVFKSRSYGIKVMDHLLTYFPTSDRADDAQMAIAEYQFSTENYLAAGDAFQRVRSDYPRSEWSEKATYRAGLSYFNINKGQSYDRDSLIWALQMLRLYRQQYPQGSFTNACDEALAATIDRLSGKEMEIALFYLKQDQEVGARVHLANLVLLFPETERGQRAAEMLAERGWDTSLNSQDTFRIRRIQGSKDRTREPGRRGASRR